MPKVCELGRLVVIDNGDIEVKFIPDKEFIAQHFVTIWDGLLEAAAVMRAAYNQCTEGSPKILLSGPYSIDGEIMGNSKKEAPCPT